MKKSMAVVLTLMLMACFSGGVLAGDLDSPAAPGDAGSAMYTLEDVYNRLDTGAAGSKRAGAFTEPAAGPGPTGHTLDEVMGRTPAVDDTNGAGVADVLAGKTFWGLTTGAWGSRTGTRHGGCVCTGTPHGTRWCDNGNGTVTDLTTCLVWLQKADWGGSKRLREEGNYLCNNDAHTRAGLLAEGSAGADLSDGSSVGDWRLPTKTELYNLANGTEAVRRGSMQAFTGVQPTTYWSTTTYADYTACAWSVNFYNGRTSYNTKNVYSYYVWPVRGGH